MRRFGMLLLIVFIIITVGAMDFFWSQSEVQKQRTLQEKTHNVEALFDSILLEKKEQVHRLLSVLTTNVDITETLLHVKQAKTEREYLFFKGELYEKYAPLYGVMHSFGVKELSLFLSTNHLFLQMSDIPMNEETIHNKRASLAYVSQYKHPVEGFESFGGVDGWRYFYPIVADKDYVGTIEIVFDIKTIVQRLEEAQGLHVTMKKKETSALIRNDEGKPLVQSIPLRDITTKETVAELVVMQELEQTNHVKVLLTVLGVMSVLFVVLLLQGMRFYAHKQTLLCELSKQEHDANRLQRLLIGYETFVSLKEYWHKPLEAIVMRLQSFAKVHGEAMQRNVNELRMLTNLLDGLAFSYEKEPIPLRILPLFEAVWQVKQLYELPFKEEGITLHIENGTKSLVSMRTSSMIHAFVTVLLYVKEQMTASKKIPGEITLKLYDNAQSVCVRIEAKGLILKKECCLRVENFEESNNELHVARLIIEREHRGIFEVICEEEHSYFHISLPVLQELHQHNHVA